MKDNFIIMIISHGRPNKVLTYKTLINAGCKLPIKIILDNTDNKIEEYIKNFGIEKIEIFDKEEIAKTTDHGDNFWNLRTTTHARNACFEISKKLNYKYFLVLDDDYGEFSFRIATGLVHPVGNYKIKKDIDNILLSTLNYYINCNFSSICFSQGGDWFGGENNFNKKPKRKAMNSFFCSVDRPIKFFSRLNEDVNTYMVYGSQGNVFMTIPFIQINQAQTQTNKGGMSEAYLDAGTYIKSFYTIMYCPSFCKINMMGRSNKRLHHLISWDNAVPNIIDEKYKK